jgi:hypothetical protein
MTANLKVVAFFCALIAGLLLAVVWRHGSTNKKAPRDDSLGGGFRDLAEESGIHFRMRFLAKEQGEKFKGNLYDHGAGLAVADFDGDGFDDIYFLNQFGTNALYRNKGDGTFEDVTREAGVGLGDRVCVSAAWGDVDNDGLPELFVTSTRGGNVLFKNLGNGRFKDITAQAKVEHVGHSQTALFFDYDKDGYLDLFVTHTAKWTKAFDPVGKYYPGGKEFWELAPCPIEHNILYHNNRDGTFADVTAKAGLGGKGWAGDAAVFDYDEDGYLDVVVTNMFGRSQLYRNNGNGTFTDVTATTLKRTSWGAAGCKVFDFNNDGKLDLIIVDMHSDMWVPPRTTAENMAKAVRERVKYATATGPAAGVKDYETKFSTAFDIHYPEVVFGNTLFKNQGRGKFQEVSEHARVETWWPWGVATGDFNNDGYEDVFVAAGMGYPYPYWPNSLLMNNGNETFTNRAREYGIEPPAGGEFLAEQIGNEPAARSSRCCAVADFDGDGRLEIVTNNFNDRPYYFRNMLPTKNYLALRLQGTRSNRDAIGAVVRLYVGKEIMTRQVHPAGGYLAQSSKTLHFGLGRRGKVDRVQIHWPSGREQVLAAPAINERHDIIEPAE